jgi:hypothetical protein
MNTKVLLIAAAGGIMSAQASATTFSFAAQTFSGTGSWSLVPGSPAVYTGTDKSTSFLNFKINGINQPTVSVVDMTYSFDQIPLHTASAVPGTGSITFFNGAQDATLNFSYNYQLISNNPKTLAMANIPMTITFTGGTGWLAGVTSTTSGSISSTLTAGGTDGSQLKGNFQAVPEPTSMAVLALGGIGVFVRRRK